MPDHAIVLCAGRGERLRPLTDHTPKPLLEVGGRPLAAWHLQALAAAGVREAVLNTAWLEERFEPALGDGAQWGLRLRWSREGQDHGGALETAGGIAKALPHLGEVFWVVAGDVFLPGFPFDAGAALRVMTGQDLAHLWMVPNAPHHPQGDFALGDDGQLRALPDVSRLTWASVGLFRAELFRDLAPGQRMPLRPRLDLAASQGRLGGSVWAGPWIDVGTPQRLEAARDWVAQHAQATARTPPTPSGDHPEARPCEATPRPSPSPSEP